MKTKTNLAGPTRMLLTAGIFAGLVLTADRVHADDEAPAPPAATPRIVVEIANVRNAKGVVRCSLFASADGFPTQPEKAAMRVVVPSSTGRTACVFENVKPGTYAIGFLHDENNNGKMDTNFFGAPKEGYGASNNARGSMGPPKFGAAKFTHDTQTTLRLKMEY